MRPLDLMTSHTAPPAGLSLLSQVKIQIQMDEKPVKRWPGSSRCGSGRCPVAAASMRLSLPQTQPNPQGSSTRCYQNNEE